MNNETDLKPMTISELADRWGVSVRTARKWIHPFRRELGEVRGRIFTIRQVRIILGHLE